MRLPTLILQQTRFPLLTSRSLSSRKKIRDVRNVGKNNLPNIKSPSSLSKNKSNDINNSLQNTTNQNNPFLENNQQPLGLGGYILAGGGMSLGFIFVGMIFG